MLDKIKGTLIGGAAGDALGYAVEFMEDYAIFNRYGELGITEYSLEDGKALISDDTQMTMFTIEGLLHARQRPKAPSDDEYIEEIYKSYLDWFDTQRFNYDPSKVSERSLLMNVSDLYSPRAPGNTCLLALESSLCGTLKFKINNSKGCGGVMRIAPIPLMLSRDDMPIERIDMLSARASAITHGHELGYIPSAFISHVISALLVGQDPESAVMEARRTTSKLFCGYEYIEYFDQLMDKAITLANDSDIDDLDAIRLIGQGWVAEETAAIAVYCFLKHKNSFGDAVIASVNHSGDSDSTGAVTGNLIGAYLGYSAIPNKFIENLEHREILLSLAESLASKR